jgi:hypothetical protein
MQVILPRRLSLFIAAEAIKMYQRVLVVDEAGPPPSFFLIPLLTARLMALPGLHAYWAPDQIVVIAVA